jgi:glycosyltransferase 2 family protein
VPPPRLSALSESFSAKKATRHVILTSLRLAAGIGILLYLAKSGIVNIAALAKLAVRWPITLAAIAVFLADIFLMAVRASRLFRPFGMRLTILRSLQLTLLSLFFSTFLPGAGAGDLIKLYYATKENAGQRTTISTILLFDRVMGFFALLVLPLLFAPFFPSLLHAVPALRAILIVIGCISGGLLAAFLLCAFNGRIRQLLARDSLPLHAWRNVAREVLECISILGRSPGTLVMALLLSLLTNLSLIAVTTLAFLALDPTGLAAKMCLIIPIGYIVNNLPLTPGGLGIGETAFNALFVMTGLHGGAQALLCWRVWKALVGLLGFVIYVRGVRGQMFDSGPKAKEHTAVPR